MMNTFLVHITLPDIFSEKFYDLIPKQRAFINGLMKKRIVLSYSLDMERKNVWVFIEAENERKAMDIISSFPIIRYIKVSIHELAFYDASPVSMPELILN